MAISSKVALQKKISKLRPGGEVAGGGGQIILEELVSRVFRFTQDSVLVPFPTLI